MTAGAFPRAQCSIAGAATWGVGEAPGHSAMEIAMRSAMGALDDAGLSVGDVDAVFGCLPGDLFAGLSFAEYLGIYPRFTDNNRTGGSSFISHLITACHGIAAGSFETALIAYGSNQRTGGGRLSTPAGWNEWDAMSDGLFPVSGYALAAARHMHEYGTTRTHLAEVAVSARKWAAGNPEAFVRDPLTIEDCLNARTISSPLGKFDCCLVTDGGAAIVVTSTERARDLRAAPVPVLGAAAATWYNSVSQSGDLTTTAAAESGPRAYRCAGIGLADVDVVQLYDAFTINTILFLEDLGFCPKGEGGAFVADGAIAPGGRLAVNTNGGGLSFGHPGMYGLFTLIEGVRQIRGEAANPLADVDIALAHANGGTLSSQATAILGSLATI